MLCWGVVSFVPVVVLGFVREKNRPARLVGDTNGTKFALCVQNARNRVILGEQGEFYPGSGGVWLVLVEFCCDIEWRLLSPGDGAKSCEVPGIARSFARRRRWARPPVPSGPSDDLQAASLGDMLLALWGSSSG